MKEGKKNEKNEYVKVHTCKRDCFYNWDEYLDRYYIKKIPAISIFHYFKFDSDNVDMKTTIFNDDVN